MSKSTKIIAGLGAVAMLGVAAMPLATFATNPVSGDVVVKYTIPEEISMSIDGVAQDSTKTTTYDTVTNLTAGGTSLAYSSTILVATNAANGYKLSVVSDGADANLDNGNAGTIAPFSSEATTSGEPAALSAVGWGLKVTSFTNKGSTAITPEAYPSGKDMPAADHYYSDFTTTGYNGVDTTGKIVLQSGKLSATVSDTTVINYGVKAATDQPAGTYQDTLTYTAAVNS